jgi:prepilin-type processing-associated H-X9-DG protein
MYPEIQKGIEELESATQCRIREGLLKSLPGPALYYALPAGVMVEAPMGGFVVIAKLSDAELFERTMTSLGKFISAQSEGVLQVGSQQQDDGRTVHVWAAAPLTFAQMMPTWSVADDHVIIGSNTALCDLGVKQLLSKGADGKSLADTDGFKKIRPQLPDNLIGLTYADSAVQFKQMRMQLQQVWPLLTMGAMQAKVKLPVMLPALDHIANDMGPSVQYSYFGPEGLHSYYRGPGLEVSTVAIAGGAVGAAVLMPALPRVRQLSFRMTSGANLSGIGKACLIHANDHDDRLPPNLQTLVEEVDVSPQTLESKRKPAGFDGPSYVYIPGQTLAMNPGNIVAYEDPRYCREGVNVLFLDSHVEFMKPDEFRRELQETCRQLGREVPQIEFKE